MKASRPDVTYPPLGTLKPVADGVWIVDGPAIMFGRAPFRMPFPTRTTVIRTDGGRLLIHSPTELTPSLRGEIDAIGRPAWILAPNRLHYWWTPDWRTAYPAAELHLAPGVRQRARWRRIGPGRIVDTPRGHPWDGEVETLPVRGRWLSEIVLFHRASRTLVLTDMIESFEAEKLGSRFVRWLARLGGVLAPDGSMPRDMRLNYPRGELRRAVVTMLAWRPERIIIAHGRWYERNGAAELRRAFRWLLTNEPAGSKEAVMTGRRPEVVVITGASAGVGRATVREFARSGASLALIARGKDRLEAAAREVERVGGRALVLPLDVTDEQAVERAASRVEAELGPIDIWINNAMATVVGPFMSVTPEEFRRATDVTYFGQVNGLRAALKRMLPRDRGTIVLVGSALAYRGIPLQSAYCAAKHAVQGLFDSLRSELIHNNSNVHVTMVQLPGLNTPQFDWARVHLAHEHRPVGTVFQPEVAARAIHFAAHSRRKELLVGWPTVEAVVGNKIASGVLDRYLAHTAVEGQEDQGQPVQEGRQDNLFEPVPGDFAAHGRFDHIARESSRQLWASINRVPLALAVIGALGLLAMRSRR